MTARERIEAALQHREPDRTPVFEYVLLSPLADRLLGRPYAGDPVNWGALVEHKGWDGAVRQSAVDRLDLALLLGHDMMYVVPVPPPQSPAPQGGPSPVSDAGDPADPVERVRLRNQRAAEQPGRSDDALLVYAYLQ